MTELTVSLWPIAVIFFCVALAYSSVGLGGGSSYTALLLVFGFSTLSIPLISLSLNLLVTSVGSFNFIRHGHLRARLIIPFIISSVPMAWLGGAVQAPVELFQIILLMSLIIVVYRIYFWQGTSLGWQLTHIQQWAISLIAGAVLGLLAGIVGIGGGIYLVPLIIVLGLGTVKEAAACGAVFIWINSLAGLISRLQFNYVDLSPYYPLLITVIFGGTLGSLMGASKLNSAIMEKLLGLIVVVAVFILSKSLFLTLFR